MKIEQINCLYPFSTYLTNTYCILNSVLDLYTQNEGGTIPDPKEQYQLLI